MIVNGKNTERFARCDSILKDSGIERVLRFLTDSSEVRFTVCDAAGDCLWKPEREVSDTRLPICPTEDDEFREMAKRAMSGPGNGELLEGGNDTVISMVPVCIDNEPVGLAISSISASGTEPERRASIHEMTRVCAALISELMAQEHALADMTEEIAARYEDLSLIYEMNRVLDVSAKRTDVLDTVVALVAETLETDLVFVALPGMSIEKTYSSSPLDNAPSSDLLKSLIANISGDGTSIGVNNINANGAMNTESVEYAHAAIAPLRVGEFVGSFSTFRKNANRPFFSGDIKLLEAVSAQLSLALNTIHVLEEQKKLFDAAIFSLARLTESRDPETGEHLERMSTYARILADRISKIDKYRDRLGDDFVEDVYRSSPLHDIGKVGIPDSILLKDTSLTAEEWEIMKTHTTIGGDTLRDAEFRLSTTGETFLTFGKLIAYCHHEKWDGSGYPKGLSHEQIPLAARIVALADAYDAMTSKRCYKDAISHEETREEIIRSRGTHFDPDIVDAFLAMEDEFLEIRRNAKRSEGIGQ